MSPHVLWMLLVFLPGAVLPAQDVWASADSATVRLAPAAFPNLPGAVRDDLVRRGCLVPQSPEVPEPHNVISGSFVRPGQIDWAVLCSIARSSRILVFRGGTTEMVDSIAPGLDRNSLQGVGNGRIAFSRVLAAVDAGYIRALAEAYGGSTPTPIDHQGIEDIFYGKASVIRYHYRGEWLTLQGAD